MIRIATLTLNPTIDLAYEVERLQPIHKMRARRETVDPGGGGINVARVAARLGAGVEALYLSGGVTGATLDALLKRHCVGCVRLSIAGDTRISTAIYAHDTEQEYRVVAEGPSLSAAEWEGALDRAGGTDAGWLVASGSLPAGVPADFYARLAARLAARGVPMVLDSSGEALRQGLRAGAGAIMLVKPSEGEMRDLAGKPLECGAEMAEAAQALVRAGGARLVAVTLGRNGALLADGEQVLRLAAVPVEAKSAVGAGDSFVAAMTVALAGGLPPAEAFRHGVAAGTAAVMTPGTDLCHREDVERMLARVPAPERFTG